MADIKTVITELQDNNIQGNIEEIAYSNLEIQYCVESMKSTLKDIHTVLLQSYEFDVSSEKRAEERARILSGDKSEKERESKDDDGGKKKGSIAAAFAAGKEDASFGYGSIFKSLKESITGVLAGVAGFAGQLIGFTTSLGKMIAGPFKLLGKAAFLIGKSLISLSAKLFKFVGQMAFKGLKLLMAAANAIRVFMMSTFIPGMISMFTSIITALTPVVVAAAPFIAIAAAVGVAIFAIYKLLERVTESLGFESVGETLMYGVLKMKDAFSKVANLYIMVYNGIMDFIKGAIDMLPDFLKTDSMKKFAETDMGKADLLDTDSAEKYKEEKQKQKEANEKQAEAEKEKSDIAVETADQAEEVKQEGEKVAETERERQKREMAEFKARAKAAGGVGYTETTGAGGETVATTMKPTALGQASLDAAAAVDSANAAKLAAPVTPTPEPKTAAELAKQKEITDKMKGGMTAGEAVRSTQPLPVSPSGKPVKVSKPMGTMDDYGSAVEDASVSGEKIDELDAKIAELDAAIYDRATFEGMTTREEVQAKKEELFKERKKLRDEKEKLKAQQDAAFAKADAALGDTGDDFYADETSDADFYGDDGDLEDTSGMTLTSSSGGTTVTGGTETVRSVDPETLARDRAAVDASRKREEAEQEAFRQLEAEGVIGADEFIMDDDPRYAQLQQRTEAIMSGKSLQPGGTSQALTGQLSAASAEQRDLQAAGAAPSINAPTSNNINNNNVSATNTLMPPPPSTDTTDRYASQFGAGR